MIHISIQKISTSLWRKPVYISDFQNRNSLCLIPIYHAERFLDRYVEMPPGYDKMTVLTVYLSTREIGEENSIFHLLNVLLSDRMEVQHKKEIIDAVYHIDMDDKLGEEMTIMCNLSEAIEDRGIEKGIEQGTAQFAALTKVLLADARLEDLQRATDDQKFRKILYEEYHIV